MNYKNSTTIMPKILKKMQKTGG